MELKYFFKLSVRCSQTYNALEPIETTRLNVAWRLLKRNNLVL